MSNASPTPVQPPTGDVHVTAGGHLDPPESAVHVSSTPGRDPTEWGPPLGVKTVGIDPLGDARVRGIGSRARRKGGGDKTGHHLAELRRWVLDPFRAKHGWEPGHVWNPWTGGYEPRRPCNRPEGLENLRPRQAPEDTGAVPAGVNTGLTGRP